MKKIASTILITSMLVSHLGILAPQKALAVFGAGDVVVDPPNLGQNVSQALDLSKSTLKEALAAAAKRLGNKILNKMLKKTVNWAVSGFGPWGESTGQPFYVQNQDSLLKNVEDQQLLKTIQELGNGCEKGECPYSKELARTLITQNIKGNNEQKRFDLDKYSTTWKSFTEEGKFSEGGGWKAWEGMYNNPQNSAFGSFLSTTAKVEERQITQVTKEKEQLANNDGFLSLRKCIAYKPGTTGETSEIDFTKFVGKSDREPVTSELPPGQGPAINLANEPDNNTGEVVNQVGNDLVNEFNTYGLPGVNMDNCLEDVVVTPGSMAKDMLSKTLTSTIDKQIADTATGNTLLDSIVDLAAVFITNGLDKMITKTTTKTGDQQLYAGGIGDPNTTYLGYGNPNSPWYTDQNYDIVLRDPANSKNIHPDIAQKISATENELLLAEDYIDLLRELPEKYKSLDECLPGPDYGWEQRLRDLLQREDRKLATKSNANNEEHASQAQVAYDRHERIMQDQIGNTRLAMMSIIPSSSSIQAQLQTVPEISARIKSTQKKITSLRGVLSEVQSIQVSLQNTNLSETQYKELQARYSLIERSFSTEDSTNETKQDILAVKAEIKSFDQNEPNSLLAKCIAERRALPDKIIGKDLGKTLFCPWQFGGITGLRDVGNQFITKSYAPNQATTFPFILNGELNVEGKRINPTGTLIYKYLDQNNEPKKEDNVYETPFKSSEQMPLMTISDTDYATLVEYMFVNKNKKVPNNDYINLTSRVFINALGQYMEGELQKDGAEDSIDTSPYDPGRQVRILEGTGYTESTWPWRCDLCKKGWKIVGAVLMGGANVLYEKIFNKNDPATAPKFDYTSLDCEAYYRARISEYIQY